MTKSGSEPRKENPFSPTFPVNPRYFVNREHIISSFRRSFDRSTKTEMPTPDNIAILGDPGMGKTSLLRKFEAIALEEFKERVVTLLKDDDLRAEFGENAKRVAESYRISNVAKTWIKLYEFLIEELYPLRYYRKERKDRVELVKQFVNELPIVSF